MRSTMKLDKEIQVIAGWLANGDRFLAEELRSEMHLAIINTEEEQPDFFYLRIAKCRAIDYLRSRASNNSYGGKIEHISLQAIKTAGYQIDTDGYVYPPEKGTWVSIGDKEDG